MMYLGLMRQQTSADLSDALIDVDLCCEKKQLEFPGSVGRVCFCVLLSFCQVSGVVGLCFIVFI